MPRTEQDALNFQDRLARLQERLAEELSGDIAQNPRYIDALNQFIEEQIEQVEQQDAQAQPPPDMGLSGLIGLGNDVPSDLGATQVPQGVEEYDETITSERIIAIGDLYYIYQHEKIGVFRAVHKLKELFEAGTLRLSSGPGAFGLYRFDRRQVLRYTRRDRLAAYRRALGYGSAPVPAGSTPNTDFHRLFTNFIDEVARFWRDKRISDVIRERAYDPSFGSIATVRRAGLDLRNNLKWASYGHVNVLRVEVMQLLDESFRILSAPDVREQFGAENAWDVVEEVMTRYFKQPLETSPRQRMAVTGRDILRWIGQPYILKTSRSQFETLLGNIAGDAEEWLTSAETLGLAKRSGGERTPWQQPQRKVASSRKQPGKRLMPPANGQPQREYEYEYEL